jgi:hypothetical protein
MTPDTPYLTTPGLAPARLLQRLGQWDTALDLLGEGSGPSVAALRAEVLVDRHLWRLDRAGEALAAVAAARESHPVLAALLTGQLEYWRRLFRPRDPAIGDREPTALFAEVAAEDPTLRGWATFWRAVADENLDGDLPAAAAGYTTALEIAGVDRDLLLESYVVRHQSAYVPAGDGPGAVALLRRSLQLRAACGARPHVVAAQVALADALGQGDEADELRSIALVVAAELRLTWLLPSFADR